MAEVWSDFTETGTNKPTTVNTFGIEWRWLVRRSTWRHLCPREPRPLQSEAERNMRIPSCDEPFERRQVIQCSCQTLCPRERKWVIGVFKGALKLLTRAEMIRTLINDRKSVCNYYENWLVVFFQPKMTNVWCFCFENLRIWCFFLFLTQSK